MFWHKQEKDSLFFLYNDYVLVKLTMPKNNAKPWENAGKENGKKKTSRNKPTIKKNDKLSKESKSIFSDLNEISYWHARG